MRSAAARAMAPPARRPLAGNGWSRIPHQFLPLAAVLSLGEYAILLAIEAHTSEGDNPPEWTGKWYDAADQEVSPVDYFRWLTGLDEGGIFKCLRQLRNDFKLIDVEGEGRRAKYRPRPENYRPCRAHARPERWKKGPRVEHETQQPAPAPVTQAIKLDCPDGIHCRVREVVEIKGVLRNTQVADSLPGSKDSLNCSEPKQKRNHPAGSPEDNDKGAGKWAAVKAALRAKLTPVNYANWVEGTEFMESRQGIAVVSVPDESTMTWLAGEPELMAGPLAVAGLAGVKYVVAERREGSGDGKKPAASEDPLGAPLRHLCAGRPVVVDETLTRGLRSILQTPDAAFLKLVAKPHVRKKMDSEQFLFCLAAEARRDHLRECGLLDRVVRAERTVPEFARASR